MELSIQVQRLLVIFVVRSGNCMRHWSIILFLSLSISFANVFGQSTLHKVVEKQLKRSIYIPPDIITGDSCFFNASLLLVKIDKKNKPQKIQLSDSAPDWLIRQVEKLVMEGKFDNKAISEFSKKMKLRNTTIIFPLFLSTERYPCGKAYELSSNLFEISQRKISGRVYFEKEIEVVQLDYWSSQ